VAGPKQGVVTVDEVENDILQIGQNGKLLTFCLGQTIFQTLAVMNFIAQPSGQYFQFIFAMFKTLGITGFYGLPLFILVEADQQVEETMRFPADKLCNPFRKFSGQSQQQFLIFAQFSGQSHNPFLAQRSMFPALQFAEIGLMNSYPFGQRSDRIAFVLFVQRHAARVNEVPPCGQAAIMM